MIVGVTGKNGSGKEEVLKYLESKKFKTISLSDMIREEARERGLPETREILIQLGNELRENFGAGVLGKMALERMKDYKKVAIGSIRNPKEVSELRKGKDFILIGIDAPVELRYRRISERNRKGDSISFVDFKKIEEIENSEDKNKQQLDECLKMADFIIKNDKTIEELHKAIDKVISKL